MGKDVRNPSLVQQTLSGTTHWQTGGQLFALLLCWSTWHCWLFPPWNTTLSKIPYYGAQRDLSICLFCRLFSMSLWILECSISLPLFFLTSWLSDILTAQNSYLCLTHLFICLPNISSWMSERQLKFNMFKSWLIPSISLSPYPSSLSHGGQYPANYTGPAFGFILHYSSLHTHTKSVRISHQNYPLNIIWIVLLFISSKLQAPV